MSREQYLQSATKILLGKSSPQDWKVRSKFLLGDDALAVALQDKNLLAHKLEVMFSKQSMQLLQSALQLLPKQVQGMYWTFFCGAGGGGVAVDNFDV